MRQGIKNSNSQSSPRWPLRLELLEALHDEGPLAIAHPGRLRDDLAYCQYMRSLMVRAAVGGMVNPRFMMKRGTEAINPVQVLGEGEDGKCALHRQLDSDECKERDDYRNGIEDWSVSDRAH